MPGQGPAAISISAEDIEDDNASAEYAVVPLTRDTVSIVEAYRPVLFGQKFANVEGVGRAATVGVGDTLVVNIWEAAPDGLFSSSAGKSVSVPTVIDQSGFIFIPYAGRIQANGRTVEGLRVAVEERLKGKAIEPQVSILVEGNESNSVVVVGDVVKPGQYPISVRGSRILEVVAQAGGAREASYETVVTLKRGRTSGTARFEELIDFPENNVRLAPGDNVLLSHKPRTYSAFGAVGQTKLVPFKTESVTLAEALAQVGGLKDFFADAGGVFLFRYESADLLRRVRPDLEGRIPGETFPVVYKLNFRQPNAFFMARSMEMRDKDIIYVANHPTAEFGKFLQLIGPLLSNVNTANGLVSN